ncbi:MAG: hypothetical protein CL760_09030 [Chloroflexi bacterium]|nr:hypothetical protein [Chloroflexota bacterium]|tara:strand:+ start:42665 stop:43075 length:411 start_codon:yes stop_codon:yes gene_type:complete
MKKILPLEERLKMLDDYLVTKTPEEIVDELNSFPQVGRPADELCKSFSGDLGFVTEFVLDKKERGMKYDKTVTFYDTDTGKVEGVYYYYKGHCNYILSWGFEKNTLGEDRKKKTNKKKIPFFSLTRGFYNYADIDE